MRSSTKLAGVAVLVLGLGAALAAAADPLRLRSGIGPLEVSLFEGEIVIQNVGKEVWAAVGQFRQGGLELQPTVDEPRARSRAGDRSDREARAARVFILHMDEEAPAINFRGFGELLEWRTGLAISSSGRTFELRVAGSVAPLNAPQDAAVERLEGYSLVSWSFPKYVPPGSPGDITLDEIDMGLVAESATMFANRSASDWDDPLNPDPGGGGGGSSGCSTRSCSVSCGGSSCTASCGSAWNATCTCSNGFASCQCVPCTN